MYLHPTPLQFIGLKADYSLSLIYEKTLSNLFGLLISIKLYTQNDSLALLNAKALYKRGRYLECIEKINKYLAIAEAEPEALRIRRNGYLELNRLLEAQAKYELALAIIPEYRPTF